MTELKTLDSAVSVKNWAWLRGDPLENATALWDPDVPRELGGQYAFHVERDGEHLLLRDALGVNKLFFSIDSAGCVHSSNYLFDLRRRGRCIESIFSVPSGHRVRLRPEARTLTLEKVRPLSFGGDQATDDVAGHAGRIRRRLELTFERVARAVRARPVYVTLSGGLDSTVVAALARETLADVTALTFCVGDESASRVPGSDLYYAQIAADALRVPLEVVSVEREELSSLLDTVLIYGQDWRPFNVHCGLVNAALGQALARKHAGGQRPVVLTGDTMNELMADYSPVTYRGSEHYRLPRLDAGRLRRFLVGGLDAGDREVGILHHFGVDTIEPYAWCADAYTALPSGFLGQEGAKRLLVEQLLLERIPHCIYERPKVRAQVGSSAAVGGTLACMIDQGLDSAYLAARFAELFGIEPSSLSALVRGGYYRFTSAFPASVV